MTRTNICANCTSPYNAALKDLAIAGGGTTVVPKIFSGEFYGGRSGFRGLHELAARGFDFFFAENHEVLMHAMKR